MQTRSTIFAHSSGSPPAAIAVIRISGPRAFEALRQLTTSSVPERRPVVRALYAPGGELLDEALVLRFEGPTTATGEDLVELHCHGGRAVVDGVLSVLGTIERLRLAEPGEFTRRAFENGRIDLTEAEGLADLLESETELQRRNALLLTGGALRRQAEAWSRQLLDLSAQAEAAIDYVDDADETEADARRIAAEADALADELRQWLDRPRAEPLKRGIRIVLAGPPNAGKSSLLNALAGDDKAIVTPIPGTTRDVIEVPVAFDGIPFVLVDTAGLREATDEVERIGVDRATLQMQSADILLWLGEPEDAPEHQARIHLHARADQPGRAIAQASLLPVSAVTGEGLGQLRAELVRQAKRCMPAPDQLAINQRQAETLEKVEMCLRDVVQDDIVLTAEAMRAARSAMGMLTGRSGVEDLLDALFGRFCLGK